MHAIESDLIHPDLTIHFLHLFFLLIDHRQFFLYLICFFRISLLLYRPIVLFQQYLLLFVGASVLSMLNKDVRLAFLVVFKHSAGMLWRLLGC